MLVPELSEKQLALRPGPTRLAIFGSTGSIGESTLEIVRTHPERFSVSALIAGSNAERLVEQADEFSPQIVGLSSAAAAQRFRALNSSCPCVVGEEQLAELAQLDSVDVVLAAIVGSAGLRSTLAAIEAGKTLALANKESLVAAGALVRDAQVRSGATILPVDSEHSALFQALQGNRREQLEELILTASGGPFLHYPKEALAQITPAQAVKHPRWKMGAKISIDSATLVNKALELIEANWLFGVPEPSIRVLVHPQSIVHSLVSYRDGTQMAQLSVPDMKGPIAYALNWPEGRLSQVMKPLRLEELGKLEFLALDNERFPAVSLARSTLQAGGAMPALFNIVNEEAVSAFMQGRLPFDRIVPLISEVLDRVGFTDYSSLSELLSIQALGREVAQECVGRWQGQERTPLAAA